MNHTPDNTDDIIDSRDIIARLADLEQQESEFLAGDDDALDRMEDAELAYLRELAEEGRSLPDWEHGETLVRDSYFTDYAQQLAEDIGAVQPGASWPNTCIDWERAAAELRMDYTPLTFDGITYWARA